MTRFFKRHPNFGLFYFSFFAGAMTGVVIFSIVSPDVIPKEHIISCIQDGGRITAVVHKDTPTEIGCSSGVMGSFGK